MNRNPMAGSLRNYRQQIVPDKREKLTLSAADFEAFVEALENPPAPTAKLIRLMRDG